MRSNAIRLSVCLLVCPSVRLHILKTIRPNSTKFSVHVTCGPGSVLFWQQCNMLYTSGFVDDVMFSHNGANEPESKTRYVSSSSPGGGTGGKVYRLRLHRMRVNKRRTIKLWLSIRMKPCAMTVTKNSCHVATVYITTSSNVCLPSRHGDIFVRQQQHNWSYPPPAVQNSETERPCRRCTRLKRSSALSVICTVTCYLLDDF